MNTPGTTQALGQQPARKAVPGVTPKHLGNPGADKMVRLHLDKMLRQRETK